VPLDLPVEPTAPVHIGGVEVKGEIVFEDKKPEPTDADVQALLDAYLTLQQKAKAISTKQTKATVRLSDNLPVGMVYLCDPHIGSWGWAAQRMLEDLKIIGDTEGLFSTLMGDEWDNFIFNFGKWANMMPIEHQRKIAHYILKRLIEKTVACVGGNHLDWTEKAAGINVNAELASHMKAVFFPHRGDLYVKAGEQEYHNFLHHKSRGASTVNKTNSARVTSNDIGGADVIVEADKHEPWLQYSWHQRRKQVWLRGGTYKIDDDFTAAIDFEQGKWEMPMCIYLPDRHEVIPFMDFREGLPLLAALRAQYASRTA
jgi:hypothetical protein